VKRSAKKAKRRANEERRRWLSKFEATHGRPATIAEAIEYMWPGYELRLDPNARPGQILVGHGRVWMSPATAQAPA